MPLTWPISKALDWALGEDIGTIHSADGLKELLAIHVKHGAIDVEQGHISTGAITYADKLVKQIMTPYNTAFKLSATATLNHKLITDIFKSGYSRIPVYETDVNDVIGLLFVKDLIFVDPDDETPVKNFIQVFGRQFHLVWPDEKLGDVLRIFKQGKSHMAIVRDVNNSGEGDPYFEMLGLVTLEDIIEEILQSEIKDEGDVDDEGGVDAFDYGKLRLLDKGKLASDKLTKSEALAVGAHLQRNIAPFKTVFYDSGIPDEPSRPSVVYADSVEGDVHTPILGDRHVEMTKLASKRKPIGFLEHLLDSCPIIDQVRKSPIGNSIPDPVDFLFTKDKPTDSMVIVITGKITVMSGSDDFQSEAGPWSVLGARALGVRATDGEMTRRVHSASLGEADLAVDAEAGVEQLYIPDFSAFIATPTLRFIRISRADYLRALHGKYAFGSLAEVGREQDAVSGSSKRAAKTLKGQAFNAGSGQGQLQLSLGRDRVAFTIRAPKDSNTSSGAPSASADAAPTPNVSFPAPPSHPNAQRTHSNPKQLAPPSTSTSASASI